jgi:hypothetical protein
VVPNLSPFARKLTIFGYWRILLQKSAVTDDVIQRIHLGDGVLSRDPDARYAFFRAVLQFGEHRRFTERPLRGNNSHWARILPLPEVLLTDQSKKANHGHGKAKRI